MYGLSADDQWSLRSDGSYSRPCGYSEHSFYWDSIHNGIADILPNVIVDVRPDIPSRNLFNEQNVTRAWKHLKHLYPLLGAHPEEQDGNVRFVVFKDDLKTTRPDELIFREMFSEEQVSNLLSDLANTKRTLSPHHLARVHILMRLDAPQRVHIIFQIAHSIDDGIAQATITTTFLDLLVKERPLTHRLEDRLALSLASDTLRPVYPKYSPRNRWRMAIAAVMAQRKPLYGGHTLPRKVTTSTPYSSVISRRVVTEYSPELSSKILAGCKKMGITFGNVYPVIGQVAAARLLFRYYMQGKISEAEWEFRKRQPMLTAGPLNARSMLDKQWYNDGGKGHVCVSLAFFILTLPFMPLGDMANVKPSAQMEIPPFSSFLSKERFLLRSQMVKKQFQSMLKHPLYFEMGEVPFPFRVQRIREGALRWVEEQAKPEELRTKGEDISPMEASAAGPVWTHAGSSFGNTDGIYPTAYPLDTRAGEEPILKLDKTDTMLRCRPAELYLGSIWAKGKMSMFIFWDANVYEEDVVKEYLDEVRGASEWYLANGRRENESAKL